MFSKRYTRRGMFRMAGAAVVAAALAKIATEPVLSAASEHALDKTGLRVMEFGHFKGPHFHITEPQTLPFPDYPYYPVRRMEKIAYNDGTVEYVPQMQDGMHRHQIVISFPNGHPFTGMQIFGASEEMQREMLRQFREGDTIVFPHGTTLDTLPE